MKVTICIPIFRPNDTHLKQCLESVKTQTYNKKDIFVQLLLDGERPERVEELAAKTLGESINYALKSLPHQGLAETLRHGLSICETKYFARMDSDDIMLDERIEKQIDYLERNKDVIICGSNAILIDSESRTMHKRKYTLFPKSDFMIRLKMSIFSNPIIHPSIMGVTDAMKNERCYEHGAPFEDYKSWSSISGRHKIHNLNSKLIKYRIHTDQSSRKRGLRYAEKTKIRVTSLINLIKTYPTTALLAPILLMLSLLPIRDLTSKAKTIIFSSFADQITN